VRDNEKINMNNKYLKWFRNKASIDKNIYGNNSSQNDEDSNTPATPKTTTKILNTKILFDSLTKLDPRYLAKNNPVMFTVEVGFIIVLSTILVSTSPNYVIWYMRLPMPLRD
jgi:hypothetical protein